MTEYEHHKIDPVHPGELLGEILEELDVSAYALAKAIGKAPIQVSRILTGKAAMTANMARLIGEALGTSAEMWVKMQSMYDLEVARTEAPAISVRKLVDQNGSRIR